MAVNLIKLVLKKVFFIFLQIILTIILFSKNDMYL